MTCLACGERVAPDLWSAVAQLCNEHAWEVVNRYRHAVEADIELARRRKAAEAERRESVRQGNGEGSLVYYARIGDYIKIGFSTRLKNRLKSLRADELLAIEPGGLEVERERHHQFADERIDMKRENFRPSPTLEAHVAALHERYGLPHWATLPRTSVVTTRRKESA